MTLRVVVLLPAAGCGERMGCRRPKQFCIVHDKPMICHTADAFLQIQWVEKIIIVASPDASEMMAKCVAQCRNSSAKIVIVPGGATRHRSILCGIDYVANAGFDPDILVVHDGVRPLVPLQILVDVVEAAKENGAAGVANPLVSTVIAKDENNFLKSSLDRAKHFASEMPQAFKFPVIQSAYKKCTDSDLTHGTECLQLVLKYADVRARLVPGSPHLWKVTHKKDIYSAEGMLAELEHVVVIAPSLCISTLVQPEMCQALLEKFSKVEIAPAPVAADVVWNMVYVHNESLQDVLQMLRTDDRIPVTVEKIVHVALGPLRTVDYFDVVQTACQYSSQKGRAVLFICLQNQEIDVERCKKIGETAATFLFGPLQAFSGQVILL